MQKQIPQKFITITVLLIALLAIPWLSHADNGKGLGTIPQTGQKADEGNGAEEPKFSDENIEAYLGTLKERSKQGNPVVEAFAMGRILAVLASAFVFSIYIFIKYRRRISGSGS
jgi:hypothetical protein